MSETQDHFEAICKQFVDKHENVAIGKMMSSEAMTYKKKVFAFYMSDGRMGFKLGREFNPEEHGISEYAVLSPFKNKAPMVDWLLIPDHTHWETLSEIALNRMKDTLG